MHAANSWRGEYTLDLPAQSHIMCLILFIIWQYKIGQLYMIARHSLEQSAEGEGVEVIENEPCEDQVHGKGQYTEKRIHLSRWDKEQSQQIIILTSILSLVFCSRLPYWIQAICPRVFYVTEKSWNYYPYTMTGESFKPIPGEPSSILRQTERFPLIKVACCHMAVSTTAALSISQHAASPHVCCNSIWYLFVYRVRYLFDAISHCHHQRSVRCPW